MIQVTTENGVIKLSSIRELTPELWQHATANEKKIKAACKDLHVSYTIDEKMHQLCVYRYTDHTEDIEEAINRLNLKHDEIECVIQKLCEIDNTESKFTEMFGNKPFFCVYVSDEHNVIMSGNIEPEVVYKMLTIIMDHDKQLFLYTQCKPSSSTTF